MTVRMLRAIVVLPGTALVFIPAAILIATRGLGSAWWAVQRDPVALAGAVLVAVPGLVLATWTSLLFVRRGRGTPAPWDPPRHLVIAGPYRRVRNPMLLGAIVVLFAESILFGSLSLLAWAILFWALNTAYFRFFEEPALERRFGEEYREYRRHVPRWAPRISAWSPDRNTE